MKNLDTVMTRDEAWDRFKTYILPSIIAWYEADGVIDKHARREEWNNYTDALCKDGLISDWQYANWTHPDELETIRLPVRTVGSHLGI